MQRSKVTEEKRERERERMCDKAKNVMMNGTSFVVKDQTLLFICYNALFPVAHSTVIPFLSF